MRRVRRSERCSSSVSSRVESPTRRGEYVLHSAKSVLVARSRGGGILEGPPIKRPLGCSALCAGPEEQGAMIRRGPNLLADIPEAEAWRIVRVRKGWRKKGDGRACRSGLVIRSDGLVLDFRWHRNLVCVTCKVQQMMG